MASKNLRLEYLVEEWEPALRRAFLDAVYNLRDAAQVELIVKYLEEGDIDKAVEAVGLDDPSLFPFLDLLRDVFIAGGVATALQIPKTRRRGGFRVEFHFNVRNPDAETFLSDYSSRKVTEILTDQRALIRASLRDGLARGINPRKMALDLVGRINKGTGEREGGLIGLTATQAEWVGAYENELRTLDAGALERLLRDKRFDRLIRAAIASGKPIDEDQISSMVAAYKNRALRWRAENIARTEALTALHAAQLIALQQATQKGLDPQSVTFTWHATHDLRTRPSHAAMDGQVRPMGSLFRTGNGSFLAYPGDPDGPPAEVINCRCWLEPNIDFLRGIR